MLYRSEQNKSVISTSRNTNYRFMTSPEKIIRLRELQQNYQRSQSQVRQLKFMLSEAIEERGVAVDNVTHQDLVSICEENYHKISEKYPPGSFLRLFWEQQQSSAKAKSSNGMRWDPLMIRWCLYLRHLSGRAYELLRESGVISLPSQRTLRDYTYYTNSCVGFSDSVDEQLMQIAKISSCPEKEKYVGLLMDEMHIKANLVYNKHSGNLIGFINLGDVNNHLLEFERSLKPDSNNKKVPLAHSMLTIMVQGLFNTMHFPYVQLPCTELCGDLIYDPFWEAVGRLERCGFYVLSLTCDGLAANRRFFSLHDPRGSAQDTFKVPNPFSDGNRFIYFFSDPPHLLKTVRNAWHNSKRLLWNQGKDIAWSHLLTLYERNRSSSGLSVISKLKYEHVYLNSFSKMRVDLAAQVLSDSVAKGLELFVGEDAKETAKFADIFNKFFDCFNVTHCLEAQRSRNEYKLPYRSAQDIRLRWLQQDFLGYLSSWEESVRDRDGFSRMQKKQMMLSTETLLGLRITGLLF
jgi:hypothetical protein